MKLHEINDTNDVKELKTEGGEKKLFASETARDKYDRIMGKKETGEASARPAVLSPGRAREKYGRIMRHTEISVERAEALDDPAKRPPIQNKIDGLRREEEVKKELEKKYPEKKGYKILSEVYLLDKNGNKVIDPVTGKARRIDFVVIKDGKVVDMIEVTSKTADKREQTEKENRIRQHGGCYIKDPDGNLIRIDDTLSTRIERRDLI